MKYAEQVEKHKKYFTPGPETLAKKRLREIIKQYTGAGRTCICDGVRYFIQDGRICCAGVPDEHISAELHIIDGTEVIADSAFFNDPAGVYTALMKITIPATVDTIGDCAFSYCEHLREIHIQSKNLIMYPNTFYGCTALRELDLHNTTLTLIPMHCCYNCRMLQRVYLPPTVTAIGEQAFSYCDCLQEIHMPKNVSIGAYAFSKRHSAPVKKTKRYYYN